MKNTDQIMEIFLPTLTRANWHEYCLLAVDGDCSAGAMGDKNSALPVQKRHMQFVAAFLKASLEWDIGSALDDIDYFGPNKRWETLKETSWQLRKLGVFHHKWHVRTRWILVERDCLEGGNYGNNWHYED